MKIPIIYSKKVEDTSSKIEEYYQDKSYLNWLIDYYCINHDQLKMLIKLAEFFTDGYK